MPFKFRHLCDLLQALDDNRAKKRVTRAGAKNSDTSIIISWFNKHDKHIPRRGSAAVAFLSCLFPERRADRVYNIQEKRLEKIVGRSLLLSSTRLLRLSSWRTASGADFAQTVQIVMGEAEFDRPRPENEVTLEEINVLFDRIAATCGGSAPELRRRILDPIPADEALIPLFRRLQGIEAKWFIRMFLKRYTPIELPEILVMDQFHVLLPHILRLQNCLIAAIKCLDDPAVAHICPRPRSKEHEQAIKLEAGPLLKPQVGVMVQRPSYDKARSIQHCCDLAARRRISVERKYDGEYCQVHIDCSMGKNCIKIFSKSGKDSTDDRIRLHGAIRNALRLGKKECPIKQHCILEGELLIWHEKEQRIQPFEKIRKHVTRNGRFLGNDQDSPRDLQEKVMIIFYDLLLYDDLICINEPLNQRRIRLRSLVQRLPGQAELGYREKIDFASSDAKAMIRRAFAKCISRGWEGFVLKGCDDPYFSLAGSPRCIKLKKDYIAGLGDIADLAVIGGRRDARDEHVLNVGKLNWTTFYLACLENRDEVLRFSAKPRFRIVGAVSATKGTISPDRTRLLNERGQFERVPYASNRAEMAVIMDQKLNLPTELFRNPFVVEVVGGGFEKPANVTYHSLRFPRITKIHEDRSWHDIMSFDELQDLADNAQAMADNGDSQEDREWIEKLIQADPVSKFVSESSPHSSTRKDPGSITPAGHISRSPHPSNSPLLVHIDVQEMTSQECHDQTLIDRNRHSPHIFSAEKIDSSGRKRSIDEHNPTANMSTKRSRILADSVGKDVRSYHCAQKPSPPVYGKWRRPLLEIQNPYATSRMPLEVMTSNIVAPLLNSGKVLTGELSGQAARRSLKDAPQSTPPTSTGKKGQSGSATTAPTRRSTTELPYETGENRCPEGAVQNASSREVGQDRQQIRRILQSYPSMIFLSPAVLRRRESDSLDLFSRLATIQTSFTYSHGCFLDNVQTSCLKYHMAIISTANPNDAGNEIGAFHEALLTRLKRGQAVGQGHLVFFDWDVLHVLSTNGLGWDLLKPYFGGCLAWKSGRDATGKGVLEVKDIWTWEEVMCMVE